MVSGYWVWVLGRVMNWLWLCPGGGGGACNLAMGERGMDRCILRLYGCKYTIPIEKGIARRL